MSEEFLREMRERIIVELLDVLILGSLNESASPMGGYDVISLVRKRFGVLLSSGTVYGLIYAMEREGLIRGMLERRKRVYKLTEKGKEIIQSVQQRKNEIIRLIKMLL
ncbi:MAG: Transcriptional regulator PadR-like family protein [Candidatus Bathyarchaeota archaeon BA2]|nr:MAG: Transcriptional regulator PadR-like family protein [Candidatus Bathyarchaeota archaeon BA2]